MAEKLRSHESAKSPESGHEQATSHAEAPKKNHEKTESKKHTAESVKDLREKVQESALEAGKVKEDLHDHASEKTEAELRMSNPALRDNAYKNIMRQTRRHLNKPEQTFSKFIHQPVVDKVSDAAGKTVGSPVGLLVGSTVTLFGSVIYLYFARRDGFEMTPSIFLMLFLAGFVVGATLDICLRIVNKAKS